MTTYSPKRNVSSQKVMNNNTLDWLSVSPDRRLEKEQYPVYSVALFSKAVTPQ